MDTDMDSTQRPVCVLYDFSPAAAHAVRRAALLARRAGVPLRLLHPAAAAMTQRPQRTPKQLACDIEARHEVQVTSQACPRWEFHEIATATRGAGLLVLPAQPRRRLHDRLFGTLAERLLRFAWLPVLLVRHPAGAPYHRAVVSAPLDHGVAGLVAATSSVAHADAPTLVHVLDTRDEVVLRELDASEQSLRIYRQHRTLLAGTALRALLAPAGMQAQGPPLTVAFGNVADVVAEHARASAADLVAVGMRRRGVWGSAMARSMTREILRKVSTDVLLVPAGPSQSERLRQAPAFVPRQPVS